MIASCPEDVINLALVRMGYPMRVTNIYEGSKAANAALLIFGQTRDQLLRDGDWDFADRNEPLVLLKSAPVGGYLLTPWNDSFPNLPWLYEYAYPADCLKLRSLRKQPVFIQDFDPFPLNFNVSNDNALPQEAKVILCNVPNAIGCYTGQITLPAAWDESFVEAFAAALARRLAPSLVGGDAVKMEAADEAGEVQMAENIQG